MLTRSGKVAFVPETLLLPPSDRNVGHLDSGSLYSLQIRRLDSVDAVAQSLSDVHMAEYYHGCISRVMAEARLQATGLEEGSYLLRMKDEGTETYALSVCSNALIEHHLIQVCVWTVVLA